MNYSDPRDRQDFTVRTVDDVTIFVREVRPPDARTGVEPVILVHGARVPGIGSFDLPVKGGSLAADLAAAAGRRVFVMDARGYGGSDRTEAMDVLPDLNPPQSRAFAVVRDIAAVAEEAMARSNARQVALLGWATGGMWASFYASLRPERVSHLVAFNALYGGSTAHPMLGPGPAVSDPDDPDRFSPAIGAYGEHPSASLFPGWDASIPADDKASWRDPAIAAAYAEAALASDPRAATREPPAFRAPNGAMEDSFYQACGRRLFDASQIVAALLIVRSEGDFWSRPEDAEAFAHDAVHAARLRTVTLPGATHFAHLDRAEHGRAQLVEECVAWLATAD